jgi:MFS family permease
LPVTTALGLSVGATFTFIAPYAAGHGLEGISPYFIAYSSAAIVLRILFSWVLDRVGPAWVLPPALLATASGALVVMFFPSLTGLMVGGVVGGLGHGFAFPVLGALAAARCRSDHRGAVMASFTAAIDLGVLLCGPLLGGLALLWGYEAAFMGGAVAAVAGSAYFVVSERTVSAPR